ncbi:IS21 family transposase [Bacillus sp. BRMEA1]|uniref:IS21 family transposase n=1 Tax=Neobacillus endophyticus TaxID=2738405 RepID=UPI001564755D|nr:IS21 family transposase [Neobacillus endophyticus]NRD78543.1 IS21 family transposase [Neobacillus endophyticus]NRD79983.1 IS21 family transposase [Neobacillus endophyticus]NRD81019.1 IS21 family transposase [Neobacillus endophyticus]
MIQYRKILELHDEGISLRGISSSTGNSRQKVTEVIELAKKKGLTCPFDEEMNDKWIEEFLFPEKSFEASGRQPIDFEYIHRELAKPNVTLSLLHYEYEVASRANNKIPYSYRSFSRYYSNYAQKYKATMRIWRKPGEILEVDWAGSTAFIIDRDTGEKVKAYVFVATLPCSQLSYAEATLSMDLHAWIGAHIRAYEYFGGSTQIVVSDNLKTGVTKHTSRELVLNPTYKEMANHYNTIVMPARVRSPKDKPSVEGSVGNISTWIIAALRNTHCFSIEELNEEVRKKLDEFNHRPFTRKKGNRYSAFEEEEKYALSPLPDMPYKISEWRTAKVRPDYHISVESMFYSVPYEYINRQVDVKLSSDMVVVYFNHMWLTSHKRLYGRFGQISTVREHMPDNHKLFLDQTPEVAIEWAESIGSSTLCVVQSLLDTYQSEKQALQSIFSLKKMEHRYTKYEIELACKMVLSMTRRPTVKSIQTILKNNKKKDAEQELKQNTEITDTNYGFTRGASYYGGKDKC